MEAVSGCVCSTISRPRIVIGASRKTRNASNRLLPVRPRKLVVSASSSAALPEPSKEPELPAPPPELDLPAPKDNAFQGIIDWIKRKQAETAELQATVAKLGLAAVLTYGLFDAVSYTIAFIIAFLGYERSTGKNPAKNIQDLIKIVVLMWAGNNVTRPFRVGGAAALSPYVDKLLRRLQNALRLPSQFVAFVLVVGVVAVTCVGTVGLLIASRLTLA